MSESVKDQIAKVSKEIESFQAKIDEHVKFFQGLEIRYYHRDEAGQAGYERRYDEMSYAERRLALAQQKLASLSLAAIKESTDKLDSTVGTLQSTTEKLIKSSRRLEYLTSLLFLVAAIGVVEAAEIALVPKEQVGNASIITLVVMAFVLVGFWKLLKRIFRDLPVQDPRQQANP